MNKFIVKFFALILMALLAGCGGGSDSAFFNRPVPVKVGTGTNWTAVSAGAKHTVGRRADGTIWTWGANASGQLGQNSMIELLVPTQIGVDTWVAVSAGGAHMLAIRSEGTLFSWGSDGSSQLGDGTTIDRSPPRQVGTGTNWLVISAGLNHSFAFRADGTLWGWGRNLEGQQGNGFLISPVLVPTNLP